MRKVKWVLVRVIRPGNQAKICSLSHLIEFHAPKFSQQQDPCKFTPSPRYKSESHVHLPIWLLTLYNELRAGEYAGNDIATLIGCEILDIDLVVGFICGIRQSA